MEKHFLAFVLLALVGVAAGAYPKVKVQSFEMSKCPYCSQFTMFWDSRVMNAPGVRDIIDLEEFFVGRFAGGEFECLHGPGECAGNLFLLCAHNLTVAQNPWGWWDLSVCMQGDYRNIPSNAKNCTMKVQGMDYNKIAACAGGPLGEQIFRNSIAYSNSKGINETPTVIINGQTYAGGPDDPLKTVCNAYSGPLPVGCHHAILEH